MATANRVKYIIAPIILYDVGLYFLYGQIYMMTSRKYIWSKTYYMEAEYKPSLREFLTLHKNEGQEMMNDI